MSFDVFVDRFEAGRSIGACMDVFQRVLGPFETERDGSFRRLSFGDGADADAYVRGDAHMFNHFGGTQFFDCLFEYIRQSRGVAYWPGEKCSAAIADHALFAELPSDMIEALHPVVVGSGAELRQAILDLDVG
jgi:hypothetical protein